MTRSWRTAGGPQVHVLVTFADTITLLKPSFPNPNRQGLGQILPPFRPQSLPREHKDVSSSVLAT